MLPSKSMMEYMKEMNRLFPRPETEDSLTPYLMNNDQPSFQSSMVNRSSSSTDSASPEPYPDHSFWSAYYNPSGNPRLQDTPSTTRPQRAIVGRKIMGCQQTTRLMSPGDRADRDLSFWQHEKSLSITPPRNTIPPNNFFYELFPSEKTLEFKTPVKSEPKAFNISPNYPDRSPLSNNSPVTRSFANSSPVSNKSYKSGLSNQPVPLSLLSPTWSNSSFGSTIPSQRHGFMSNSSSPHHVSKYQSLGACSSTDEIAPAKMCTFCRKNGETPIVYMTHSVKEQVGSKNVVTCPILRSHVCATCGASGDNAHTITYCPVLRSHNNGKPLQSTTITLKNTRIKSNGRRRY